MSAAATAAIFPTVSSSLESNSGTSSKGRGGFVNLKPSSTSSGGLKLKATAQAPSKLGGASSGLTSHKENLKSDGWVSSSSSPRTFINQLPDWSMLLAAITTIFLAAEKQWMMLDWKPKRFDELSDSFGLGKIVQDGLIFRQNFPIRSYEIGADRTASVETFMNHLQETALNHVKNAGLLGDGFGSTPEMSKKNLIWVVTRMQVLVDRYPTWGDVVQVNTWVSASGKNGLRRDWLVRDSKTGETLTRASSVWVMMNKQTRKLSKIPDEVREEIEPYFGDAVPIVDDDSTKLPKLAVDAADYVREGLTPKWSDLDVNQHVNNVKYISWILESAPPPILESHELCSMTLEYRKECGRESVLKSLASVCSPESGKFECQHLLQLESGAEIVRGRTKWRPKLANSPEFIGQVLNECTVSTMRDLIA
ncbi:hypothetical protein QQ045_023173 [Rhodiola kirilowii]